MAIAPPDVSRVLQQVLERFVDADEELEQISVLLAEVADRYARVNENAQAWTALAELLPDADLDVVARPPHTVGVAIERRLVALGVIPNRGASTAELERPLTASLDWT